jgi:hypothetical protein
VEGGKESGRHASSLPPTHARGLSLPPSRAPFLSLLSLHTATPAFFCQVLQDDYLLEMVCAATRRRGDRGEEDVEREGGGKGGGQAEGEAEADGQGRGDDWPELLSEREWLVVGAFLLFFMRV